MKGSHPHCRYLVGPLPGDALGHLARRLVRVGKDKDSARVHALVEQLDHPFCKRLRLSRSRTGFEQVGVPAMLRCGGLFVIQAGFTANDLLRFDYWQQKHIDKLLSNYVEGSFHAIRDL